MLEGDVGELVCEKFPSAGVLSGMWERFSDGKRIVVLTNLTDDKRTVKVHPDDADAFEATLEPASSIVVEL